MASIDDFRLDRDGIRDLLKSNALADPVHELAERIANQVRGAVPENGDVVVDDYTTDRKASSVTIRHPAALALQARDGILTRAAASVGLEVRER